MAPELRHQFRVTTYDLRGHGYSEVTPKGYSAENQALDLKDLMDSLSIEKASIVGHSFGADIGLYMSLLYPERVRRLVAIEPGLAALVDQRKSAQWNGWSYWVSKLEEVGLEVPPDKRTDVDYLLKLSDELSLPDFRNSIQKFFKITILNGLKKAVYIFANLCQGGVLSRLYFREPLSRRVLSRQDPEVANGPLLPGSLSQGIELFDSGLGL